jgi:hypothetical protein
MARVPFSKRIAELAVLNSQLDHTVGLCWRQCDLVLWGATGRAGQPHHAADWWERLVYEGRAGSTRAPSRTCRPSVSMVACNLLDDSLT